VKPNLRNYWILVFLACMTAIGSVAAFYTYDASITVGHAVIAAMLGAFATGVLALGWFVVNAVIEAVPDARRMLR